MKVLSVRQPWAWALVTGIKDVENLNWATSYRGALAIHAGKAYDMTSREQDWMLRHAEDHYVSMLQAFCQDDDNDVRGAIIGIVHLDGCIPSYKCDSKWKAGNDPDYYCWKISAATQFDVAIPLKGRIGLWDIPDSMIIPSEYMEEPNA